MFYKYFLVITISFALLISTCLNVIAQHEHHPPNTQSQRLSGDNIQPVISGIQALLEALKNVNLTLASNDSIKLQHLLKMELSEKTIASIEKILDKYSLLTVSINPEARVSVQDGMADRVTTQNQWKAYLIKVINDAGLTSKLEINSPNAALPYHFPSMLPRVDSSTVITKVASRNRFLQLQWYTAKPMLNKLSGAKIEYQILKTYFSQAGSKEIQLSANAGKGTDDLSFKNSTRLQFKINKAVRVFLRIKEDSGHPAISSITIKGIDKGDNALASYFPLPAARVAAYDPYPDFFFQPQVYRGDGETMSLAPGRYLISFNNGPESVTQTDTLDVPHGHDSISYQIKNKYWIRLADHQYYSADHHVHAAGCSHYDTPEEGVHPKDMWRQQVGEDLNISANLAWGPSWYHQKEFFTGKDETYSTPKHIIHNDVEVSGFPSSHCGHIVLLGLSEDDYPGTTTIEQWPSWTAPVLQWVKEQRGVTGYAHSGWGLEPSIHTDSIFNYVIPKMDGIGANEYVATVTQNLVDFYSLGDTPPQWELNMLYHSWNAGFKTKLSGETDFPCITDERVGQGRSYFKTKSGTLSYNGWLEAIKDGTGYVSDGGSHIMDFKINNSSTDISLSGASNTVLTLSANVAAMLSQKQTDKEKKVQACPWL